MVVGAIPCLSSWQPWCLGRLLDPPGLDWVSAGSPRRVPPQTCQGSLRACASACSVPDPLGSFSLHGGWEAAGITPFRCRGEARGVATRRHVSSLVPWALQVLGEEAPLSGQPRPSPRAWGLPPAVVKVI